MQKFMPLEKKKKKTAKKYANEKNNNEKSKRKKKGTVGDYILRIFYRYLFNFFSSLFFYR